MRMTILDGDPRPFGTPLDRELTTLALQAKARGDACERVRLATLKLHQCVGCFHCWVKTPGRCRLNDDGNRVLAAIADADLLVFAAPMRMGFVASLLKRANDRIVPVVLPYVAVKDGECHHTMRYHPFDLALIVERGDATAEELAATERIYARLAKNVLGKLAWFKVVEAGNCEAVIDHTRPQKEQSHALDTH